LPTSRYYRIALANVMLSINLDSPFATSIENCDTEFIVMYIEILINKLNIYIQKSRKKSYYHLKFLYCSKSITLEKKFKKISIESNISLRIKSNKK
jgi:hypothetical protein